MKADSARRQVLVNLCFMVIKSVSLVVSIRMADAYLQASTMGLLLLFRRQGALWGNLSQLGFSQSLQKFYTAEPDAEKRFKLWGVLNRWVAVVGILVVAVSLFCSSWFSSLLFGQSNRLLGGAFGIYVFGLALGFMACSSWLAEFRFGYANIVDLFNGSLVFLVCIAAFGHWSGPHIAISLAFATLASSFIFLKIFASRYIPDGTPWKGGFNLDRTIVGFGVTRGGSSFLDMGTLVVGPWLLRDQPDQAGYLIIAYIVLRLAQTAIMPVAQVVALRANSHRHDHSVEARRVLWLAGLSFLVSCLVVAAYLVFGKYLVGLWLPNSSQGVLSILDRLIYFVPCFCLFYSLRTYVDLNYIFSWNLVVLSIGVFTQIAFSLFYKSTMINSVVLGVQVMLSLFFVFSIFFIEVIVFDLRSKR
jgi:hypothetical protein